jgi:hypothetical protein
MINGLTRKGHVLADHAGAGPLTSLLSGEETMTQRASDRDIRSNDQTGGRCVPPFKPVALPALAAAVRASQPQPTHQKSAELPAILRKEAMQD